MGVPSRRENRGPLEPAVKDEIVTRLALGETQSSIARQTGVSSLTVHHMTRKHADQIRELHEKLLEVLPNAVNTVKELVRNYSIPYKRAKMQNEERKQAFAFTMELLRSTGMIGGAPPAVLVQNFFSENKTVIIDPTVMGALGKYVEDIKKISQEESDVIDVGEPESQDADYGSDEGEARGD